MTDAKEKPSAPPAPPAPVKKPYTRPVVAELGDVREMTRGSGGTHNDAKFSQTGP
jgi:hypothetical protein